MITYDEPYAQRFLQIVTTGRRAIRAYMNSDEDVLVVVVKGTDDDWAAYAADSGSDPIWVAANGTKLPADIACALFPVLNPTRYRR